MLDHPVVHIIIYPDGTTNQPTPQVKAKEPVDQLFSLAIARFEVLRGELLWQEDRLPMEFTAEDFCTGRNYSLLHRSYESAVRIGKMEAKFGDFRPFISKHKDQFQLGQNPNYVSSL